VTSMRSLRRPVLIRDLTWLTLGALAALGGRLVQIHQRQRDHLLSWTDRQRRSVISIPARRGTIADANGRVMAASSRVPSVFADPNLITDCQTTARRLAAVLNLDDRILADDLARRLDRRFFWVKRRVSTEEAEAVKALKLPGIGILHEGQRHYPMDERFAHGLGFLSTDGQALAGLELKFDGVLRGQDGYTTVVTDARRRPIFTDKEAYKAPRDGSHVVLTIDTAVQAFAEQALSAAVEQFGAQGGSVIVMAPRTGEVLALANVPTFNPNHYGDYPDSVRCNAAIQSPVEPGSTFKPFIAAGAVEEKLTWPGDRIFCHNGLYVVGRRRLHDHHPYGTLTFEEVLIKSSNIGMAILGQRMGNARLHHYVTRFGFGEPTGIELPGEDAGIVLPLRRWTSYSTTSIPMGQEVAVTPLQLAVAFSTLLNDGVRLRPRVVRGIVGPDGSVEQDFSRPVVVGQVVSPSVARRMVEDILVRVVEEGTGKKASIAGYRVAGKTGTAQMPYRDRGGYEPDAYVSSFVGAAPADEPRALVYLSITRPKKTLGYYGGTVAAPAVGEILAKTLAYLGVPPSEERQDTKLVSRVPDVHD